MARNDDDGYALIGRLVAFLAFFPAVAVRFVLGGVVVYKFWHWFVVPVYHPTVNPGVLEFIGLGMFVSIFFNKWSVPRDKTEEEKKLSYGVAATLTFQIIGMLCALLIGWIMHHWVIGADPRWLTELLG